MDDLRGYALWWYSAETNSYLMLFLFNSFNNKSTRMLLTGSLQTSDFLCRDELPHYLEVFEHNAHGSSTSVPARFAHNTGMTRYDAWSHLQHTPVKVPGSPKPWNPVENGDVLRERPIMTRLNKLIAVLCRASLLARFPLMECAEQEEGRHLSKRLLKDVGKNASQE